MNFSCSDPVSSLKKLELEIKKVTQEIQILQGRKQQLISKRDKLKDAILQDKSAHLAQKNWEREGEVMNSFLICIHVT